MTSIKPILYEGVEIVPLQFLKAVLPAPESLGEGYSGKTSIGCQIKGISGGKDKTYFVYNNCDHAACYREVRAQAVSYTTGVPAMIGAKLMLEGVWRKPGVWNVEQLDPDPFMAELNRQGLPWIEQINPKLPHDYPAS
jgi:saccharopine dehydrogenase (NAD+, L-lysine-forming)